MIVRPLYEQGNPPKPWFFKLWGTGWHCPPHLQPEGFGKAYIDHPLIKFSSYPGLVRRCASTIGRHNVTAFYQVIRGENTEGSLIGCGLLLLVLIGGPLGVLLLLLLYLQKRQKSTSSLFSQTHSQYLEDIWMTPISPQTLAALSLKEAGYLKPITVVANLYYYPALISLFSAIIMRIHILYGEKPLQASMQLFYISVIIFVFLFVRSMGVFGRSKQSVDAIMGFRNSMRAQLGKTRSIADSATAGCGKVLSWIFGTITLGFFIMVVAGIVIFSMDSGNDRIIYVMGIGILTASVALRLAQPGIHRLFFLRARKKERRLLREINALYHPVCNEIFDSSKSA